MRLASAADVAYVELPMGGRHHCLARARSDANPLACCTIRSIMRGENPQLDDAWRVNGSSHVFRVPGVVHRLGECAAYEGWWDNEIHPLGKGFKHLVDNHWAPEIEAVL